MSSSVRFFQLTRRRGRVPSEPALLWQSQREQETHDAYLKRALAMAGKRGLHGDVKKLAVRVNPSAGDAKTQRVQRQSKAL